MLELFQPAVQKPTKKRRNVKNKKISTVLEMIELGVTLSNEGMKLYHHAIAFKNRFGYSVKVSEQDVLYQAAHAWLMDVLPEERHRTLEVASARRVRRSYQLDELDREEKGGVEIPPLEVRFNDKSERVLTVEGHKVRVSLITPENADNDKKMSMMFQDLFSEIIFRTDSYVGQQAVIRQLEKINQQRASERKAVLKMMNQYGWATRSDLPPRTMDSVSLPQEQKDRVITDLQEFLDAEDDYNRLAIPWHRGYMFYGPPGTGKTSFVKALANHFNLDLWYVSLSDVKAEGDLLTRLNDVTPRSLLLLEDIDILKITHDREAEQGGVSLSSLLNILDGVATPHGLITMMTTNRFDVLDPALTRAGRMDVVEELAYPSVTTVNDMFRHFYDNDDTAVGYIPEGIFEQRKIGTSQIAEILKRNMNDPIGAAEGVRTLIKEAK
jgi:AAA+ superfamily predicted ATPase